MKNKVNLKKLIKKIILVSICLLVLFLIINMYEYHVYRDNFNNKISQIVNIITEKYPDITKNEIIEILNDDTNNSSEIFKKYGIDLDNSSIIAQNDNYYYKFLLINSLFIIISVSILVYIFIRYNHKKEEDIKDIINYIEEINKKNYSLKIDSISEDELSILKSEIYKTTIMLKEAAENSNLDKIHLKESLEDISHQLKTPLTSILIMLDNIIEDENMDIQVRNEFIRDIRKEIISINFLVQALLKLSKFDANTVEFIKENINIQDIVDESIKKVSTLCDLKNINIEVINKNRNITIYADFKWQVEAITNILKNCVEHSNNNGKIIINYEDNSIYTMIEIQDFGNGISKKDLPHIFERFYKGEKSSKDSIGIGLSLSKKIIEQDNGYIEVDSKKGNTIFSIKYIKK